MCNFSYNGQPAQINMQYIMMKMAVCQCEYCIYRRRIRKHFQTWGGLENKKIQNFEFEFIPIWHCGHDFPINLFNIIDYAI